MYRFLLCIFSFCYIHVAHAADCTDFLTPHISESRTLFFKRSLRRAGTTDKLARLRYGEVFGAKALSLLQELGPHFDSLVSDPGLVLRVDDFVAFAKKHAYVNPWEAREAYSKYLGKARVFRALALTPEMAQAVSKRGLLATYLRDEGHELRKSPADPYAHNIFSMMRERWRNGSEDIVASSPELPPIDSLLSVTYNLKIAKLVAGGIVKSLRMPEVKMYIYEIEIPVIELMARPGDSGQIESFVFLRIYPDEIISVKGPLEPEMIEL